MESGMRIELRNQFMAGSVLAGFVFVLGSLGAAAETNDGGGKPVPTACQVGDCYQLCDDTGVNKATCYKNCDVRFLEDCNATHTGKNSVHMSPTGGVKKMR
jgi:hypothetical protein